MAFTVIFAFTACTTGPKNFEEEVRDHFRDTRGFFFLKIPPRLLTLALRTADNPDMNRFFGDARQVGIISFGDGFPVSENREVVRTLEDMLTKYDYKEIMSISDSEKLIIIKLKETNGRVTDLVTIVSESEGAVTAITLSGEIDVQAMVGMAGNLDNIDMLMQLQALVSR